MKKFDDIFSRFDIIDRQTDRQARQARLVPAGWVTVFEWVNHLGAEPGTYAYSA